VALPDPREVVIRLGGFEVARTTRAIRVLETSHPPTWYLPPEDVRAEFLHPAAGSTVCEWKGRADYWDLEVEGHRLGRVAWSYPAPLPDFSSIRDHFAFYPSNLECTVGGEPVEPQPGDFYGGWVTPDVAGPFKGGPGTRGW